MLITDCLVIMRPNKSYRKTFCLLSLLVLILVGCNFFQPKQFNVDGTATMPVKFEYPFNWDGVYSREDENEIVIALEKNDVNFENDFVNGYSTEATVVSIELLSPDELEVEFGDAQITPLEILNQQKSEEDALWEAWHSGDIEEVERIVGFRIGGSGDGGLVSATSAPPILIVQAIEEPHIRLLGGREIAVTKQQIYITMIALSPFSKSWVATLSLDDKIVQVFGVPGSMSDEKFEEDFYQIVGSLGLIASE
jgi:hypothetical protein